MGWFKFFMKVLVCSETVANIFIYIVYIMYVNIYNI